MSHQQLGSGSGSGPILSPSSDDAWLALGELSLLPSSSISSIKTKLAKEKEEDVLIEEHGQLSLSLKPWDTIILSNPLFGSNTNSNSTNSTGRKTVHTVLQVVLPSHLSPTSRKIQSLEENVQGREQTVSGIPSPSSSSSTLRIHPLLWETLSCMCFEQHEQPSSQFSGICDDGNATTNTNDGHIVTDHQQQQQQQHQQQQQQQSQSIILSSTKTMSSKLLVHIQPLPYLEPTLADTATDQDSIPAVESRWEIQKVDAVRILPPGAILYIRLIVYCSNDDDNNNNNQTQSSVLQSLRNRLISQHSTLVTSSLTCGLIVLTISDIEIPNDSTGSDNMTVFRIPPNAQDIQLSIDRSLLRLHPDQPPEQGPSSCPGYENLVDELTHLALLPLHHQRPTGVLITGCAGVGKTHLVLCWARRLPKHQNTKMPRMHWVSVKDLLLQASWASQNELLQQILPPQTNNDDDSSVQTVLVLDDLQALESLDLEAQSRDTEWSLVRNSVLVAIDKLVEAQRNDNRGGFLLVVGITQNAKLLPPELVRIHRLEKEIRMEPPTQLQREEILGALLLSSSSSMDGEQQQKYQDWVVSLSGPTAGFVAADLKRMLMDAWTSAQAEQQVAAISLTTTTTTTKASEPQVAQVQMKWKHVEEAARRYVPSQLAQLDVIKTPTRMLCSKTGNDDAKATHEWAWQGFGGYAAVKQRIFRTIVNPWRRSLAAQRKTNPNENTPSSTAVFGITPPRGVLFHGPSGTGKTLAATCLASSLGLQVVQIRASDVLDPWLGGSEAAIRSLFARARAAKPCILFFDEIDAIACNREGGDDGGVEQDVTSRILTTFLNEMDGVSSRNDVVGGVLVVACTNRKESLDAALLRPGRLEEHIELGRPEIHDIEEIMRVSLRKAPLSEDVDLFDWAELLFEVEATSADVEAVCRDACSIAIRLATSASIDSVTQKEPLWVSNSCLEQAVRRWKRS